MNRYEKKYHNTEKKLIAALVSTLEKKDFDKISISDICREAGVSRTTFYGHCSNTAELLANAGRYKLHEFNNMMKAVGRMNLDTIIEDGLIDELNKDEIMLPFLYSIETNRKLFMSCLKSHEGQKALSAAIKNVFFIPFLKNTDVASDEDADYLASYFISGTLTIIYIWIKNGCVRDKKEICELIRRCIGPRPLQSTEEEH